MDKRLTRLPTQEIDPELGQSILQQLYIARHLQGVLLTEKNKGYGTSRAYSVGKPDFEYHVYLSETDTKVAERKRLRVVERWFNDAAVHGVVNIQMSHIYRGDRQTDDVQRLGEAVTGYVNDAETTKVVLEDPRSCSDTIVKKRLFLGFMANGKVIGRLVSRDVDILPYTDGSPSEHHVDMAHYYAERPFFEEDYRYSTPQAYDVVDSINYVKCFIQEERQLASLRSALQG